MLALEPASFVCRLDHLTRDSAWGHLPLVPSGPLPVLYRHIGNVSVSEAQSVLRRRFMFPMLPSRTDRCALWLVYNRRQLRRCFSSPHGTTTPRQRQKG